MRLLFAVKTNGQSQGVHLSTVHKRPPIRRLRGWMLGLAWRFGLVLELVSGRKSSITRESVQNTNKKHTYASDFLERTLESKGVQWQYEPIEKVILETAPYVVDVLGPAKQ